ncbi:MAG: 2,3-bisphosphoglycerate-independent phosphoglycerate mutase [Marinifilaceae bacterium]|jgi:2,3-bisphosphoglycerate-independent phosphoglycerate mutase|nr:2,3-bisphosphoglycerate-independent phosphoglycerate mutase [Marinifilaceae bacterium]
MKKTLLMILDGWGIGDKSKADVISQVDTPYIDSLLNNYPNASLEASGEFVGLPNGQMGNSEVGHLNIGAGRVVYQDLVRINKAVEDNSLAKNKNLINLFNKVKENKSKLHLIGLVGDGGVHSLSNHAIAVCAAAKEAGVNDLFIHGLTDGRDTDPRSGYDFLDRLIKETEGKGTAKVASIVGRYYGMDRDNNWDRIKLAYDAYTKSEGIKTEDLLAEVKKSYENDITDEFIKPIIRTDESGNPIAKIEEGDAVLCFNYRTDRLRQMTTVFSQEDKSEFGMNTLPVHWATMTCYNSNFKNVNVIFDKQDIKKSLGQIVAENGMSQVRIAETEKYAHVTFFFSGGREDEFMNEKRILVPSPKVATYDLQPEMSAPIVAKKIVDELNENQPDFVCLNFANCDMVGHTGVYDAITKAVQTVDNCVEKVVETAKDNNYEVIIIADHGNADRALNNDGSVNTAHTTNPVPVIWVTERKDMSIKKGKLADVAPTILSILGLKQPSEMTGEVLIS